MLSGELFQYSKSLFVIYDNATSDTPLTKWEDFLLTKNTQLRYDSVARSLLSGLLNDLIGEIEAYDSVSDSLAFDMVDPAQTPLYFKYLSIHANIFGEVFNDKLFQGYPNNAETPFDKAVYLKTGAKMPSINSKGIVVSGSGGMKGQLVEAIITVFKAFLKGMVKAIFPKIKLESGTMIRGYRIYEYLKMLNIICEMKCLKLFDIPLDYM